MLQIKNLMTRFKVQFDTTLQWTMRLEAENFPLKLRVRQTTDTGNLPGRRYRSMALTASLRKIKHCV